MSLVPAHHVNEISHKHVMRVRKSKRVKGTGRVARMGKTGNNDHKFSRIM